MVCNTFRYAPHQDWEKIATDIKPVYIAPTASAGAARLDDFADKWGGKYPAIVALWRDAWQEFIPLLDYGADIRKVICSTDATESLKSRYRRAIRARGHFPTDQA